MWNEIENGKKRCVNFSRNVNPEEISGSDYWIFWVTTYICIFLWHQAAAKKTQFELR